MTLSILGYIVVPISVVMFFLKDSKYILYLAIFFSTFAGSSIINLSFFSIPPAHFIFILYWIKKMFKNPRITINYNKLLGLFLFIAALSIIKILLFDIDVFVYGIGNGLKLKRSEFSYQNITQYMYLMFGACVYNSIKTECKNKRDEIVNVLIFSSLIVMLIGVYQIIAKEHNLIYDDLFRDSLNSIPWQTMNRIQSVFGEASFLGQFTAIILALKINLKSNRNKFHYITILFYISIGILTISSTFFISMVIIFLIKIFTNTKFNINRLVLGIVMILILSIAIYMYNNYNNAFSLIIENTFNKLTLRSHSGIERSTVARHMFNIGFQNFFLGIGYGSGRSTDVYTNIFSTTGFLGIFAFLAFIICIIVKLYSSIRKKTTENIYLKNGLLLAMITYLVTGFSVPDLFMLYLWVIFGVSDSFDCERLSTNEKHIDHGRGRFYWKRNYSATAQKTQIQYHGVGLINGADSRQATETLLSIPVSAG